MIKLLRKSIEFDIQKCVESCNCSDEFYNEKIYGVHLNCCHKILEQIYTSQQMVDFKNLNDVNVEQFLIHFLNMPLNYSIEYTDGEIQKTVNEIIQFYSKLGQILDTSSVFDLVKKVIFSLSYKLPDFLEFKEEYYQNEFHIEEAKPIDISNANIVKNNLSKIKVKKDELTFWTRNCTNDIEILCKTKYYETVNELLFIYKQIGARAYSICNDNYEKYLGEIYLHSHQITQNSEEQMPNILAKIAEFKIQCWYDADMTMREHKFI